MKYLSIIIILIAVACGSSNNISNNSTSPTVKRNNIIQVKINEEKTIQLPGWVSSGPQMNFTLSDTSIAKVSRKEVVSTFDSTALRPGDPVLANWTIKGLKSGTTRIKFTQGQRKKNEAAKRQLKNLTIVVTD
jgi:predicted secreted protein